MTTRFKAGDKDYIRKLNEMGDDFDQALASVGSITEAAQTAETSATLAGQHKDSAEAAALAAGTSETNSANSATLAGQHKDTAEAAALAASTSESNSANSATLAGQHKDTAEAAALAAGTSETNSANSATLAGQHKDTAEAASLAAGTSESNSANSATLAGQHKDTAEAASLAAGTSETNSANSATLAGQHKDAAEAAALVAGTSETNSADSATLAGQHKDTAQMWAESDTEVEAGKYSAKHWAYQAAQVVTDGLLDDEAVSQATTWSSAKISNELGQKAQADDPRLSDAREWNAETVTQAEAEEGSSTDRRAWTAQRVRQAIIAVVGMVGNATQTVRGWMSPEDKTKLDGIAAGATANATDAELRDRATHTGVQAISTVSGLESALNDKVPASSIGVADGVAGLDSNGVVPLTQLPDFTSDGHTHGDLYYTENEVDSLLSVKTAVADIRDNLISPDTDKPLSANQGRVLKGFVDNLNALLTSDDTTLDELQEIVDFIKQNKTTLDTLGVSNIAGLQAALDGKATVAQGALADTAVQPGDNVSTLVNDLGFLTEETDPVFMVSPAATISAEDLMNWNTSHTWGDHSQAGYQSELVSGTTIKTLNGQDILGSGNLVIESSSGAGFATIELYK
jgi:hypothetical protein